MENVNSEPVEEASAVSVEPSEQALVEELSEPKLETLTVEETRKLTQVFLTEFERNIAKRLGNGKISRGIRNALRDASFDPVR